MVHWSWKPSLEPWDTPSPGLPARAFPEQALLHPLASMNPAASALQRYTPKSIGIKAQQ